MPKYRVHYWFNGQGSVIIEAKSKDEAESIYHSGDWRDEEEDGQDYEIDRIEEE